MSEPNENELNDSMNVLWKCTEKYAQLDGVTENSKMLNKLREHMASYCMLDLKYKASVESLARAQEADLSEKTFQQAFDEIMIEKKDELSNYNDHAKYKKYMEKVRSLIGTESQSTQKNEEEDDLVITQAEVNIIDPITKQVMISPMKNKNCGHSYGKQSINLLFRKKKRQRCPYVGCPSVNFFTVDDLEEDYELGEVIKRQRIQ